MLDYVANKRHFWAFSICLWYSLCYCYYTPFEPSYFKTEDSKSIPDIQSIAFCSPESISLACPAKKILIFHQANYIKSYENESNLSSCLYSNQDPLTLDLITDFNSRCSFRNTCYFNFTVYFNGLSRGILSLSYNCIEVYQVSKSCGIILENNSGYIASPGYPDFYPLLNSCEFSILAEYYQTIELTLLDMHVKGIIYPALKCSDVLVISEKYNKIIELCDTISSQTFYSKSNYLQLSLTTKSIYHRRGFLAYYKRQGCLPPPPPTDGYLVTSNRTHALYVCCLGYVFPDTLIRNRLLSCVDGNRWSSHVPDCYDVEDLILISNTSATSILMSYLSISKQSEPKIQGIQSYTWDTLVPLAVIVILVIGNTLLIMTIIIIRKRTKEKPKSVPLFYLNGTIHKM